jgi:hypothetical protein
MRTRPGQHLEVRSSGPTEPRARNAARRTTCSDALSPLRCRSTSPRVFDPELLGLSQRLLGGHTYGPDTGEAEQPGAQRLRRGAALALEAVCEVAPSAFRTAFQMPFRSAFTPRGLRVPRSPPVRRLRPSAAARHLYATTCLSGQHDEGARRRAGPRAHRGRRAVHVFPGIMSAGRLADREATGLALISATREQLQDALRASGEQPEQIAWDHSILERYRSSAVPLRNFLHQGVDRGFHGRDASHDVRLCAGTA